MKNFVKHWYKRLVTCRQGKHLRSKHRARKVDGKKVSVCRYCGIPMYKDNVGFWRPDTR